ncbi:DUF4956 domain-containing protein [Oscillibacter sp.]|uniref:DUF4956 domain-containing protein n=1 Tax=Oscillibacter sp. TaxID=1945593 RepID=UPI002D8047DD|nr:DUF4956 domain-containing protein [Oscillibacter sp.]
MRQYLYDMINSTGTLSTQDVLIRVGMSILFGLLIFVSYRLTHEGSIYSTKFNITLLTLTILTTMVMTVIGNNVALSLGMVGALSIVRFRTSIKDSRDTTYIFWTIIIGICCGVGDFMVASIGSAGVFLVLLVLGRVKNENRVLLVVRGDFEKEDDIRKTVFEYFTRPPVMKAENTSGDSVELIYELDRRSMVASAKRETTQAAAEGRQRATIIRRLRDLGGIEYVNIVVQSDEIS